MGDYIILVILEFLIMDVFFYFSGEEEELELLEKFNIFKVFKLELVVVGEEVEGYVDVENE